MNINARHHGRSHDAAIWSVSAARAFISDKFRGRHWWLLGDSGYPLEPWLLVPYANPQGQGETVFNRRHKSMRSLIEKVIGEFSLFLLFIGRVIHDIVMWVCIYLQGF